MTERVTAAGRVETFLDAFRGGRPGADIVVRRTWDGEHVQTLTTVDLEALVRQARALRALAPQAAAMIEQDCR